MPRGLNADFVGWLASKRCGDGDFSFESGSGGMWKSISDGGVRVKGEAPSGGYR